MWFCFFLFSFFLRSIIYDLTTTFALEQTASTTITASIGENRVTIYGYTSPNSRVELSSSQVFSVTYSDSTGYFLFDKTLLPKVELSDLCLSSIDNNSRQTTPVCFPPPPATNYHTDIGPILLPPTISLENSQINPNSTVTSSGQAIPNSQVSINFYKVNDSAKAFLIKDAFAYSLPSVSAATDSQGNFSLNLPTAYASNYRLYATAKFDNNYSPKSNTLIYILPSLFYLFLQQYPLLKFLIPLFIFTLIVFVYILHLRSKIYHLQSKNYLPALRTFTPAILIPPKTIISKLYHLKSKI